MHPSTELSNKLPQADNTAVQSDEHLDYNTPNTPTSLPESSGRFSDDNKQIGGVEGHAAKVASLKRRLAAEDVRGSYNRKSWIINLVLDEMGYARYQYRLFLFAGLGWLVDNMIIQGLAVSLPFLAREFGKSDVKAREVTVSLTVGMVIGAFFWSWLSDHCGRRPAHLVTVLWAGIFTLAAAFTAHWPALCVLLAFAGIGIGGSLVVEGVLFMEFVPPSKTRILILLGSSWACGYFLINLIGYGVLSTLSCNLGSQICAVTVGIEPCCDTTRQIGWRIVLGVPGILAIAIAALRIFVFRAMESPKFLISKDRDSEAVSVLGRLAVYNKAPTWMTETILHEASHEKSVDNARELVRGSGLSGTLAQLDMVRWLRQNAQLRRTVLALFVAFPAIGLAYPLFCAFLPQFFRSITGGDDGMPDAILLRNNLITSAYTLPAALVAYRLADTRLGRRWTIMISAALAGAMLFVFAFTADEKTATAFTGLTLLFQNVMYSVIYAFVPERVPAPIRASTTGLLSGVNRIAGLSAPLIATFATGMGDQAFVCVSGGLFLFAAAVFFFVTETRGQASL